MVTVKFGKKQIEWQLWLLKQRYGKATPRTLVMRAIEEVTTAQSNVTSLETTDPKCAAKQSPTLSTKQKRARAAQKASVSA